MTARELTVGVDGESLPVGLLQDSTTIFGRKRVGKSNNAAVIVEAALRQAQLQTVILDPKGDWWGITSSADGRHEGFPVVIIGGKHATLPLNIYAGAAVADWVIETGYSVIVDLSGLDPQDVERFCSAFLGGIRRHKTDNPSPILVVIDEADELAPEDQRERIHVIQTYRQVVWMVKRGGFAGVGTLVVTQRPASLSKNVTTQSETVIVLQVSGSQDLDAIAESLKHHAPGDTKKDRAAALDDLLREIVHLAKGATVIVSAHDALRGRIHRIQFARRSTFDSGATPTLGEAPRVPKVVAKVAIDKLSAAMERAVAQAKANDPDELRARIAELEAEIAERPDAEPEVREVRVLTRADIAALRRFRQALDRQAAGMQRDAHAVEVRGEHLRVLAGAIGDDLRPIMSAIDSVSSEAAASGDVRERAAAASVRTGVRATANVAGQAGASAEEGPRSATITGTGARARGTDRGAADPTPASTAEGLSASQQRALDVIVMLERRGIPITRASIASWIPSRKPRGLHPKGGSFGVDLAKLRELGYIDGGTYGPTDLGRRRANPLPRGPAGAIAVLTPSQVETLGIVSAQGPLTRVELAAARGVHPKGGSFGWDLTRLMRMGVMTRPPFAATPALSR